MSFVKEAAAIAGTAVRIATEISPGLGTSDDTKITAQKLIERKVDGATKVERLGI